MEGPTKKASLQGLKLRLEPDTCTLLGEIKVANIAFEKNVYVRYSTNVWSTNATVPAKYAHPMKADVAEDGLTKCDLFNFEIPLKRAELAAQHEAYVEFNINYECNGQLFIDDNSSKNYRYKIAMLNGTPWAPAQVCMIEVDTFTGDVLCMAKLFKKLCFKEKMELRFTTNDWTEHIDVTGDCMADLGDKAYYSFKFNSHSKPQPANPESFREFRYERQRSMSIRKFPADFYDALSTMAINDKEDTKAYDYAFEYAEFDEELELAQEDHGLREALRSASFRNMQPPVPRSRSTGQHHSDVAAERPRMIGFAICYYADDREFWDNNDGHNYGFTRDGEVPSWARKESASNAQQPQAA